MPGRKAAHVDGLGRVGFFRPFRLRFHDFFKREIVDRPVLITVAFRLIGIVVWNLELHDRKIEEERLIRNIIIAVGKIHVLQIAVRRKHGVRAVSVHMIRDHMRIGFMRIEIGFFRPNVNVVFAAARRRGLRTVDRTPPLGERSAQIDFNGLLRERFGVFNVPIQAVAHRGVADGKQIVDAARRGDRVHRCGHGGVPSGKSLIIAVEKTQKRRGRFHGDHRLISQPCPLLRQFFEPIPVGIARILVGLHEAHEQALPVAVDKPLQGAHEVGDIVLLLRVECNGEHIII